MLIEGVKLIGNLVLRDFLEKDDVRALDRLLDQEVQLMVNIASSKMNDKKWLMNIRKLISQSGQP